jgi:hypothetical protein
MQKNGGTMAETMTDSTGGSDEPTTGGGTRVLPFEFRGEGKEYFKIWIVNILLTILTIATFIRIFTLMARAFAIWQTLSLFSRAALLPWFSSGFSSSPRNFFR